MNRYTGEPRPCGEVRRTPRAPKVMRYSGKATVEIQYLAEGESFEPSACYAFKIWVDGLRVNVCAIGAVASVPERERASPETYDDSARGALSFTVWEMERDAEQPGMDSGMDAEDFEQCLEHDEDYEIVVSRSV